MKHNERQERDRGTMDQILWEMEDRLFLKELRKAIKGKKK